MRITDLLRPEGIALHAPPAAGADVLEALVALQSRCGNLRDPARYLADVQRREAEGSTAVGHGIAVPHAKSSGVARPGLAAMTICAPGVPYGAPDGSLSTLFFMIAAPEAGGELHLELLSRLMTLLLDPDFCAALLAAETPRQFLAAIDRREALQFPPEEEKSPPAADIRYRVLAVTACPTGIAHTYLAAQSLVQKGAALGIPVKAETQGSAGIGSELTPAEIAACDGVLIAADKNIDLARFDGKPLLQVSTSEAIHHPGPLLDRMTDGRVPVYRHVPGDGPAGRRTPERLAAVLYRHLMNGVSHMLPFVMGGGILIALAFLLDAGAVSSATLAQFGSITVAARFCKTIGSLAFGFMLPILSGYIAQSIADRPGLAVGLVGGALAATGLTFASFLPESPQGVPAGFLGALFAGFAAGYLMRLLEWLCNRLPQSLAGLKPVLLYPVLGILGISILVCGVNPAVGLLNSWVFDGLTAMGQGSKILLGAVVGGMMAVDMGGPFNKAAYLFGAASLTSAAGAAVSSPVMAAVMAGGMVPPLAIALCSTFFPSRFTPAERKLGGLGYVMGLCFMTEGAIPFAAADPLRVIPACFVGSALAGGLSAALGCTLPAPHGGIFVLPVMAHPLGFLLALLSGALVAMLLLVALKKKKTEVPSWSPQR